MHLDTLVEKGLYTIKDKYFTDFPCRYWYDNKNENRPYYYLIKDKDGVDWVIPMSKQVENYKSRICSIEEQRGKGNCIYYHIGIIASKERAFLIGDMFPVCREYIKSGYTIGECHYVVRTKSLNAEIYSKAMRFLKLVSVGKIKSRNNIMEIKSAIVEKLLVDV